MNQTKNVISISVLFIGLSLSATANAAIQVSDGPDGDPGRTRIVTSDGPKAWVDWMKSGKHLVGSWIIISDGPSKSRLEGKTGPHQSKGGSDLAKIHELPHFVTASSDHSKTSTLQ